jgi:hypothetical protein
LKKSGKSDNTRNTVGTTGHDDLIDVGLGDLLVPQDLLTGLKSTVEEVLTQPLEVSVDDESVEFDTLNRVSISMPIGAVDERERLHAFPFLFADPGRGDTGKGEAHSCLVGVTGLAGNAGVLPC